MVPPGTWQPAPVARAAVFVATSNLVCGEGEADHLKHQKTKLKKNKTSENSLAAMHLLLLLSFALVVVNFQLDSRVL